MKLNERNEILYGYTDIANRIGRSTMFVWRQAHVRHVIPEPAVAVGKRLYYCEREYQNIVRLLADE